MNHIFLIRHGENAANLTRHFSHRKIDFSLNEKGILQARQTAEVFRGREIHEVFASPLKRAMETAQIIAEPLGLPVRVIESFRELNVGDLEGQTPTEELWAEHNGIIAAWMDGRPELSFPGGENYFGLLGRMRSGLMEALAGKEARNIIIIGHGGMFTCTIQELCTGARGVPKGSMPNCSITEIEAGVVDGDLAAGNLAVGNLAARLLSYASAAHLSGDAAQLVSGMWEKIKAIPKE